MMNRQAGQRGMTLLELMVSMTIAIIVMGGAVALIFQELRGTSVAKTSITAVHEISNAARWISQDILMTEDTDLVDGSQPVDYVTLNWIERYDFANVPHTSSYSLSGNQLTRDHDGTVTTVARNISKIEFSQNGRLLTVSITCTPQWWNSTTIQKTYRIYLRSMQEG